MLAARRWAGVCQRGSSSYGGSRISSVRSSNQAFNMYTPSSRHIRSNERLAYLRRRLTDVTCFPLSKEAPFDWSGTNSADASSDMSYSLRERLTWAELAGTWGWLCSV